LNAYWDVEGAEDLRGGLSQCRQRVRRGRCPDEWRERAAQYVRERRGKDAELSTIARELGASGMPTPTSLLIAGTFP
jgi:hypothetical protein